MKLSKKIIKWIWIPVVILTEAVGTYSAVKNIVALGLPAWAWYLIGTGVLLAGCISIIIGFYKENKRLSTALNIDKVRSAISELESDVIKLGGQSITMAKLFWKMGDHFLEGILPGSIPGNIYKVVEGADKDDCNKAWGNLKKRLRLLQLICDVERPHPHKGTGYIEIITTSLGTSVLNELEKRWRDRP